MRKSLFLKSSITLLLIFTCLVFRASGQHTKVVKVQNFNQISVASGIDLYIRQGNTETVNVKSSAELLKDVIIKKEGNNLIIKYKDNVSWERLFKGGKITAYVTYKTLNSLFASGGSDVFTQNTIKTPRIDIHASGGSDLKLDLMTQNLQLHASGGSDVNLRGKAINMEVNSSGGSDLDALDFIVENAKVNSSGGADVSIHVNKALEANASGGSDVQFKGDASLKNNSSKSGEVRRIR